MAENNEFFREVEEDYRRDQIARIWKRYNGLIIAGAVLLVAAVGGWRYWQHAQLNAAETASEQFSKASRLAADGSGPEADKVFESLQAEGPAGYRLLARYRAAADLGKRDASAAAAEYDKLAADTALGDGLRDLARLRAALLRLDAPDPAPALASLQGLAAPTGLFRHTAREMLGLASMKRGDFAEATRWFDQIAGDTDTPQGLRQRVEIYETLAAGGPVTLIEAKSEQPKPEQTKPDLAEPELSKPEDMSGESKPEEATPEAAAPPPTTR